MRYPYFKTILVFAQNSSDTFEDFTDIFQLWSNPSDRLGLWVVLKHYKVNIWQNNFLTSMDITIEK